MSSEQVLFDDPTANITVTNERLITGDDVVEISSLSHASCANTEGVKDYAIAGIFTMLGVPFVLSMSGWSILGLILLINPYLVFFGKHWLVFVFTRAGGTVENPYLKRELARPVARELAAAVNGAIRAYRSAHDPRANLALDSRTRMAPLERAGEDVPATAAPLTSDQTAAAMLLYEDGVQLFNSGQKREALLRWSEAVKVDPRCVEAHVTLARAYYKIDPVKHQDLILHHANSALEVEPNNAKARNIAAVTHFALGQQVWDAGEWETATASFLESYRLDPTAQHTADALATCAEQAGTLRIAIDAFEEQVANVSNDVRTRYLVGRSYVKMVLNSENEGLAREEALAHGEAHLKAVLDWSPSDPDANKWLGGVYYMTGRDQEYQRIVDLLRSVDPEKCAELEDLRS